ncbi:MAG: hypothetical protein ACI4U5_01875 [Bacilli bacterium]
MKIIVTTITSTTDGVRLNFACLLNGKIKSRVAHSMSLKDYSVERVISDAKRISQTLKTADFKSAPIYVSLAIPQIFQEVVSLPKLSKKEADKSLKIEMEKLYPGWRDRFVYLYTEKKNKSNMDYFFTLLDKTYFQRMMSIFKPLGHHIAKVGWTKQTLGKYIARTRVYGSSNSGLYLDIGNFDTIIGIVAGAEFKSFFTVAVGVYDINQRLSELEKVNFDVILTSKEKGMKYKKMNEALEYALTEVVVRVKCLVHAHPELETSKIYIHTDDVYCTEDYYKFFKRYLQGTFLIPSDKLMLTKDVTTLSALLLEETKSNYIFNPKVK